MHPRDFTQYFRLLDDHPDITWRLQYLFVAFGVYNRFICCVWRLQYVYFCVYSIIVYVYSSVIIFVHTAVLQKNV